MDVTASYGKRRDGNAYAFAPIISPGVGTTVYRGVERRVMGGGMEQGSVIS